RAAGQATGATDMHASPAAQPASTARAAATGTGPAPRWASRRTAVGSASSGSTTIAQDTTASYGSPAQGLVIRTACTFVVARHNAPNKPSAASVATPARRSALSGPSAQVTGTP